jgi:NAD(P)-dependent dehydrogenase (short-subunit alcohol dehydrogenase family)
MKNLFVLLLLATTAGLHADLSMASDSDESSRVVLVTGANRGLGLEFARQYREAGWQVIGTARKPDTATELQELGVTVVQLDVTDVNSVARMAADLDGQPIDLLINNAGVLSMQDTLPQTDIEAAAWAMNVNTLGPMRVSQALLPNLSEGKGKTIVSISSGLGSLELNGGGRFYGYRESKAALNMFARSLAAELRDEGFIVIVMDPGWVQTDMGGPNATLTPEQSISGVRAVIDGLAAEDTGTFKKHNGETVPW